MSAAPQRWRTLAANLLLMSVAVGLALGVLEVGVRLFVDMDEFQPIGVGDVNLETRLSFLPGRTRTYETSEFRYTVSTNRFGRRDIEWTPEMLADPDNLLFIGDSFALGNGVDHEFTIPSQLEAIASDAGRPIQVFNFGMPAAAITQYKLNLEEALRLGIRARTVVVNIFVGNDFDPNYLPSRNASRKNSERVAKPKPQRSSWLPHSMLLTFAKRRVSHSPRMVGFMLRLGQLTGLKFYTTPAAYIFFRQQTPDQQASFREMLEVVGEIETLCNAHGRDLYVTVFPNKIQVENRDDLSGVDYEAEKPNRLILEYCEQIGARCLDLLPVLASEYERTNEPLFFPIDRHPNVRGYRLAAESIARFVGL